MSSCARHRTSRDQLRVYQVDWQRNAKCDGLMPVIDRRRCEGKGDCVEACPRGVLSLCESTPLPTAAAMETSRER